MKKLFFVSVLFFFTVLIVFGQDLSTCNNFYKTQRFANAANCYSSLVNKNLKVPEYRMLYSMSLYNNKNYTEALKEFNVIKKYFPNTQSARTASELAIKAQRKIDEIKDASYNDFGNYFSEIRYSKWDKSPIVYWVQNNEYDYVVYESFLTWQRRLSPDVTFAKTIWENDADIKVYFTNILPCESENSVGCTNSLIAANRLQEVKVYINPTFNTGVKQNAINIMHVSLHEIGHALGIGGHSSNKNDLMYPSNATYKNASLSNRDVETVRYIYKNVK